MKLYIHVVLKYKIRTLLMMAKYPNSPNLSYEHRSGIIYSKYHIDFYIQNGIEKK